MITEPVHPISGPKILLLGYNGACNTGAEALLLADIADLRALLGEDATLVIPTINPANLRRYVPEAPNQQIVHMPTLFFGTLRRLVRECDLVMLVEGSTYMDTWSSAMLWAYLWTTHCADALGKPCLAYAVDAGTLRPLNRWLVAREASKTNLIITRSAAAAERLRAAGVTSPMDTTADNALTYATNPADAGLLAREWPEAGADVVGIAAVNFYLWPVVMRPWGRREDCYKWPLYFSRSAERSQNAEIEAAEYARLADALIEEHGKAVALIAMEALDETFARLIQSKMRHPERARVFSSRQYDASQLTVLLRSLELLITSRYHAAILSLAATVPQIGVGHDLRIKTLYGEMGTLGEWFVTPETPALFEPIMARVQRALAEPALLQARLRRGHSEHRRAAERNRELLANFLELHGWRVRRPAVEQSLAA